MESLSVLHISCLLSALNKILILRAEKWNYSFLYIRYTEILYNFLILHVFNRYFFS